MASWQALWEIERKFPSFFLSSSLSLIWSGSWIHECKCIHVWRDCLLVILIWEKVSGLLQPWLIWFWCVSRFKSSLFSDTGMWVIADLVGKIWYNKAKAGLWPPRPSGRLAWCLRYSAQVMEKPYVTHGGPQLDDPKMLCYHHSMIQKRNVTDRGIQLTF